MPGSAKGRNSEKGEFVGIAGRKTEEFQKTRKLYKPHKEIIVLGTGRETGPGEKPEKTGIF